MKICKLTIEKKDISHVPEAEQTLFLQIGIILNEINMLHKITYFFNKKDLPKIEMKAQITQSLFFHSILAGKLWECWQWLGKTFFTGPLSKEYEQSLSLEGKKNLKNITQYFGNKNNRWMGKVRNKLSFHLDPGEIKKQIELMSDNEGLAIYLSEAQGNCLYYGSTKVHLAATLSLIDESDEKFAFERYRSETLSIAGDFIGFFNHLLLALTQKYLNLKPEENEIPDPPSLNELYMPFFISR